jgi:hypothetical protein
VPARLPTILTAAALALPGCAFLDPGHGGDGRACTEEFRTYVVQVVDGRGRPVEGLESVARVERTGEFLARGAEPFPAGEGRYPVATDADRARVRPEGDVVRFTAEGPGVEAAATFEFYDDGCHLVKRAGPEQIVAGPAGD